MNVRQCRDILFSNPENNPDMLQRKCQISETNPSKHTAITDTTTNLINSDNSALLQELFCEACSTLYNDILNAIDHQSVLNESDILRRRMEIIEQGTELSDALPQLSNLITSKLSTINRAMEHLELNRRSFAENAENTTKDDDEPMAVLELRKWLHTMSEKLSIMESKFTRVILARNELDRLAADQQILQLQIETEGHTLVNNVQRTVTRNLEVNEDGTDCWIQRQQQHLKTLTKRWYHLWIRSLSVQCRIEYQLDHLYSSDEESESDPELREPQVKRRRFHSSDKKRMKYEETDELGRGSDEDIIPFAKEEYESINCETMPQTEEENLWKNDEKMKLDESTTSSSTTTTTITNNSYTIGHHHSDNDNFFNDNTNKLQGVNSHAVFPSPTDTDEQRRQRIQYSPVKSFYKTVPLDETGATDTEMTRVPISGWSTSNLGYPTTDMHVLTDSLIVNTEEEPEMDANGDIEEILSMLDDENGNPKWEEFERQGTQWREFKYGKTRYQLSFKRKWLLSCDDNNDKHSCDASSEESDDLPTDLNNSLIENKSIIPSSVLDMKLSSLKRRRKGRLSASDRFPSMIKMSNSALGQQDVENSICSQTWSEIPHLDGATASLGSIRLPPAQYLGNAFRSSKHHTRRKLRARRLPRSMSDGEHLGMSMDVSIHSAPSASVSHWSANLCRDSDTTGPDQSDAPPYEWDDYKPPAKAEDDWDEMSDREDISVLTIEDDYHMQFDNSNLSLSTDLLYSSNHSTYNINEKKTSIREKAPRPIATVTGKCIRKDPNSNINEKLELVKARTIPLIECKLLNSSKLQHHSECNLKNVLMTNDGNTNKCIQSFPLPTLPKQSPLPIILSKIEKFASSLKLIHDDDSGLDSSFSTLSSIRSLSDIVSTLKIFTDIHERLLEEQEELQSLLNSDSFSGDLSGLLREFEPLCEGYKEAVKRVEQLMAQIEAIRDKWNDWSETQRIIQMMMRTIENDLLELRKGTDNSEQICSELELCQERMNRLETVCNYLSCNLASLHNRSSTQQSPPIDFTSELALYSNALIQLKTRFEKEMGHVRSVDKATLVRSRKRMHLKNDTKMTTRQMRQDNCASAIHINWSIKLLFIVAAIAAFTAWFTTSSLVPWRTTLGPHLDYVDGPPPL
ncbi:hypothetical protein QQG55_29790 [Brugia pahangi]